MGLIVEDLVVLMEEDRSPAATKVARTTVGDSSKQSGRCKMSAK